MNTAPRSWAPLVVAALASVLTGWAGWTLRGHQHAQLLSTLAEDEHRLARILAREAAVKIAEARFAFVDTFLRDALRSPADTAAMQQACMRFLRTAPGVAEIILLDEQHQMVARVARHERGLQALPPAPLAAPLATATRQVVELLDGESFALRCDRLAVDALDTPSGSDPHLIFAAPLHAGHGDSTRFLGCALGSLDPAHLDRFFSRSLWSDPRRSVGLYDRDGQLLQGVSPLPLSVRGLSLELPSGVRQTDDAVYAFAWIPLPQNMHFPAARLDDALPWVPKRGRPGKDWLLVLQHRVADSSGGLFDERAAIDGHNRVAYLCLALAAALCLYLGARLSLGRRTASKTAEPGPASGQEAG